MSDCSNLMHNRTLVRDLLVRMVCETVRLPSSGNIKNLITIHGRSYTQGATHRLTNPHKSMCCVYCANDGQRNKFKEGKQRKC